MARWTMGFLRSALAAWSGLPGTRRGLSAAGSLRPRMVSGVVSAVCLCAGFSEAAPKLASPSGVSGIGTGMAPGQDKRAWLELGVHSQSAVTNFSPVLGFGIFVTQDTELEAILPMSHASVDYQQQFGQNFSDSEFMLGNPYLGVNWLDGSLGERLRFSAGLALPLNSAPNDPTFAEVTTHNLNAASAEGIRGRQDPYLWADDTLSVVGRVRYERGRETVMSFEGSPTIYVPTANGDTRDTEVGLLPAVELGSYLSRNTLVGGRLSFFWLVSGGSETDNAQLAIAPFIRHQLGALFLNARLTINLDGPYGFAFESDGIWGLILGGGASF